MAAVAELIRTEQNGTLSFGNYLLDAKAKKEDFEHAGDLFKVKTFKEITKLEKNGMFAYESVPGTSVTEFKETESGVSFSVEGEKDAEITLGLKEDTEYDVYVGENHVGTMRTNLGGKLSVSVELEKGSEILVKVME